uniref:Uncharacterized protein n=1 Tax=Haptolina ericina TaxID=156174 RepID=A0A7S3F9I1_9EUKA|mmetsp:Transcript_56603/g.126438  ORF Transcript_56603/g.126438 Transcript_56603/m.126438 type:complete len:182 (+) Transcript_56603:585-1130(+)
MPYPAAIYVASLSPSLSLLWCTVLLLLLRAGPPDEILFACNGMLAAWMYLRYYQPRADGYMGDPSPTFQFSMLFPSPLHKPLNAVGNMCFGIVSSCGCFPPAGWSERTAVDTSLAASELHTGAAPLESVPPPTPAAVTTDDPAVAERRRTRARALIDARLAANSATTCEALAAQGGGGAAV